VHGEIRAEALQDIADYRDLAHTLGEVVEISAERARQLSDGWAAGGERFASRYAGSAAQEAFGRFLSARTGSRWASAVSFYYAASHLRVRHIRGDRRRLLDTYERAKAGYLSGDLDEAMKRVRAFQGEDRSSPAFLTVGDSLSTLYENLERDISSASSFLEYERSGELVRRVLTVSVSPTMSARAENTTHGITFPVLPNPWYEGVSPVSSLPGGSYPEIDVRAEYAFSPVVTVGAEYSLSASYEVRGMVDNGRYNLKAQVNSRIASYRVSGSYYLRARTGFRPYFRFGLGLIRAHRDPVQMNGDRLDWWRVTVLPAIDVSYPETVAEAGLDYEFSASGLFSLGIFLSGSNHFGDTAVIPHWIGHGGLRIGVNIL
jgi:hypothetical protein